MDSASAAQVFYVPDSEKLTSYFKFSNGQRVGGRAGTAAGHPQAANMGRAFRVTCYVKRGMSGSP